MKMCQTHWDMLKKALDDRGLTPFIGKDVDDANKIIDKAQKDPNSPYEPLLRANTAITLQAVKALGHGILFKGGCPLCIIKDTIEENREEVERIAETEEEKANAKDIVGAWINGCCDAIQNDFKSKGWLSKDKNNDKEKQTEN